VTVRTQADGTRQLAYAGHLLYTFVGDNGPGDVNGQGMSNQWFAVSPSGAPIGANATPASSTPTMSNTMEPSHATTHATATTRAPHRGDDQDADDFGGPNDGDGSK
jgi:hypothetical protein